MQSRFDSLFSSDATEAAAFRCGLDCPDNCSRQRSALSRLSQEFSARWQYSNYPAPVLDALLHYKYPDADRTFGSPMIWFNHINAYLRNPHKYEASSLLVKDFIRHYIKQIDLAFGLSPKIPRDMLVFRGMGMAAADIPKPGGVFVFKNYLSTSLDPEISEPFVAPAFSCCFWVIYVPAGTPAIYFGDQQIPAGLSEEVARMSGIPITDFLGSEREFLFPRGARLRVLSVKPEKVLCLYGNELTEPLRDKETIVEAYLEGFAA
ncbi:MAG: ADP-ribosyltransferase [Sulfobacillus sp.]